MVGLPTVTGAQQGPPLDSTIVASYRQVLFALRDTVDQVSARSVEFRRDLRTVGEGTVLARSGRLTASCQAARDALRDAQPTLAGLPVDARYHAERDSLLITMRGLSRSLDAECLRGLGPEGPGQRADTLRAWGPHRTSNFGQAITAYHGAAARLARRLEIDLSRH